MPRHMQIQQDHIEVFLLRCSDRLQSVFDQDQFCDRRRQNAVQELTIDVIIIGSEDFHRSDRFVDMHHNSLPPAVYVIIISACILRLVLRLLRDSVSSKQYETLH
jgi:hypothetical protein